MVARWEGWWKGGARNGSDGGILQIRATNLTSARRLNCSTRLAQLLTLSDGDDLEEHFLWAQLGGHWLLCDLGDLTRLDDGRFHGLWDGHCGDAMYVCRV